MDHGSEPAPSNLVGHSGDAPAVRRRGRAPIVLSVVGLTLAVAPFLALARFAHASADDYCASVQIRDTGLWQTQKVLYTDWSGRFIANMLTPAGAQFVGTPWYKATGILTVVMLFLAVLWLAREAVDRRIRTSAVAWLSLAFVAVYLNTMASSAEGLYWWTSASIFTWSAALGVTAFAAALRSQSCRSDTAAWVWAAVAGVIGALVPGLNEVATLFLGLVLFASTVLAFRLRVERRHRWLVPLVLTAAGAVANIIAPGNFNRATLTGGLSNFVGPLIGSAAFSGSAVLDWLSSGPIVVAALAILSCGIVLSANLSADSLWRRVSWIVPCVVAVSGVWGAFLLTHWASGFSFRPGPPDRVTNVVLLFFLLTGAAATFMIGAQLLGRYRALASDLTPAGSWAVVVVTILLFGGGNVREAYTDLVAGRAATYDREQEARYALMRKARATGAVQTTLTPLSRLPRTIFFRDLTADPNDWRNNCYSRYWGVGDVRVTP